MASDESESLPAGKRKNEEVEPDESSRAARDEAESSSDDALGPALPSTAPKKKKRKLQHEKVYMSALPSAARYSKSLMHKEQLSFVTMTPFTDFLITSSVDGIVKFWKKANVGIEFVKEFKAHNGEITAMAVSQDGRSFATAGADATVKIFDVVTFDLLSTLQLKTAPQSICWVHKRGASMPLLAVADGETPAVHIYDGRGETQTPTETIQGIHKSSITEMAYNNQHDCVISADASGMIEYWSPSSSAHEKPASVFQYKSSTDLFEFRKARSTPVCIAVSPTGAHFATLSFPDRRVRVFGFASGKLHRSYDESLRTLTEMQQAGTALRQLDAFDFGRRLAVERDLEPQPQQKKQPQASSRTRPNVLFDESGHFLLYGSLHGTKVINILTNRVVRVFGADEALRAAHLALYQGAPGRSVVTAAMAASANPLLREAEERDPLLVCTAAGKARFYIFSNDDKASKAERDVQNEKPKQLGAGAGAREAEAKKRAESSGTAAVLHTTFGDIHLRLFPEAAPKAVENFATHARSGYYNNTIFHRVIRKFMIQGGDPLGDGTGGESIWGREFEDEFSTLRHDKPYTVSMANAGPNTNGSQFFITTEKCPWLDKKHTIFGRAVQGLDVVHRIENVRVHKEKPQEDVKIVSISVS